VGYIYRGCFANGGLLDVAHVSMSPPIAPPSTPSTSSTLSTSFSNDLAARYILDNVSPRHPFSPFLRPHPAFILQPTALSQKDLRISARCRSTSKTVQNRYAFRHFRYTFGHFSAKTGPFGAIINPAFITTWFLRPYRSHRTPPRPQLLPSRPPPSREPRTRSRYRTVSAPAHSCRIKAMIYDTHTYI
jgi:hypothetical protein